MERAIYKRLITFVNVHNILYDFVLTSKCLPSHGLCGAGVLRVLKLKSKS